MYMCSWLLYMWEKNCLILRVTDSIGVRIRTDAYAWGAWCVGLVNVWLNLNLAHRLGPCIYMHLFFQILPSSLNLEFEFSRTDFFLEQNIQSVVLVHVFFFFLFRLRTMSRSRYILSHTLYSVWIELSFNLHCIDKLSFKLCDCFVSSHACNCNSC